MRAKNQVLLGKTLILKKKKKKRVRMRDKIKTKIWQKVPSTKRAKRFKRRFKPCSLKVRHNLNTKRRNLAKYLNDVRNESNNIKAFNSSRSMFN